MRIFVNAYLYAYNKHFLISRSQMISRRILLVLVFMANYSPLLFELPISYESAEYGPGNNMINDTIDNVTIVPGPSLSVYTDKRQYVTAEPVQISGIVLGPGGEPVDNSYVRINISNAEGIRALSTTAIKDGTYNLSGFSADEAGKYFITANITFESSHIRPFPPFNTRPFTVIDTTAFTEINVTDAFLTFPFFMVYLAIACFGGLMYYIIISEKKNISFATNEVIRLVLLTIIVISPIVGLLYTESQIGINSPISFIKSPQTEELGDQWVINVGGLKTNNYQTGILIPIYVIIFGLAGGYLRYLYRTAKLRTNIGAGQEMQLYLFNWDSVPGNVAESNRLKDFLKQNYDISWLNNREFVKSSDKKTISITSGDNMSQLSVVLDDTSAKAEVNINGMRTQKLNAKKEKDRTDIYQEMSRRRWTLYQTLEDLALLILSPLLAIAVWFLLTRGGTVDKHLIAVVCFTVGLITDRIINTLINLGSGLTSPKEDSPKKTLPS
jgi:hypothetical protein